MKVIFYCYLSVLRTGTEKTENTKRFKVSPDGKLIAFQGEYGNIHLVSTSVSLRFKIIM